MCGPNDDPTTTYDIAKESPMRYEDLGPVANPDGTPTQTTIDMLAGTGRDAEAFAASAMHLPAELTGGSVPAHVSGAYPTLSCCGGPIRLVPVTPDQYPPVATGDELAEAFDSMTNWLDRVPAQDGDL